MYGLTPLLLVAGTLGCARNVVTPRSVNGTATPGRPALVLVYDPVFREADVTENKNTAALALNPSSGQEDRADVGRGAAAAFATELVEDIRKLGLRAERAKPGTPAPPNALVVVGQFIDVDEGNQVTRLVVGFGEGASRVDARIQVYEADIKLLEFETHSDSGKMPGGAVTLGAGALVTGGVTAVGMAGGAVTGGVKAHLTAIERMSEKSGEQASAYLSEYFGKQGWIAPDQVHTAKK